MLRNVLLNIYYLYDYIIPEMINKFMDYLIEELHGLWASKMPYFYVLNGQQIILIVKLFILSTVLYFIHLIQLYIYYDIFTFYKI